MANAFHSGSILIDTTGTVTTKPCKVAHITFVPDAGNDALVLYDGASTSDPKKIVIKGPTAKETIHIDLSGSPLRFATGIHATISASGFATLVLSYEGAST